MHANSKALSTLSQKTATVAENGEKTATVAEFGDSRTFVRQIVAEIGDYSRQCGQALSNRQSKTSCRAHPQLFCHILTHNNVDLSIHEFRIAADHRTPADQPSSHALISKSAYSRHQSQPRLSHIAGHRSTVATLCSDL